jgi:hypothetical protein
MAIQTFRITLRADVNGDGSDALSEIVRQFAVQLRATTVLINQGRYRPEVTASMTNGLFVTEDICLDVDATFEDGQP